MRGPQDGPHHGHRPLTRQTQLWSLESVPAVHVLLGTAGRLSRFLGLCAGSEVTPPLPQDVRLPAPLPQGGEDGPTAGGRGRGGIHLHRLHPPRPGQLQQAAQEHRAGHAGEGDQEGEDPGEQE